MAVALAAVTTPFALAPGCGSDDAGGEINGADVPHNVVFDESDVTDYFENLGYTVKPTGSGYYDVASPERVNCEIYSLETGSADQSIYVGDPNYLMDPSGTLGLQYGGIEGNDGDCAEALMAALEGFVPWAEENGVI